MSQAELTWLTSHMGHTENVHFAWYRQEDSQIELTKVAKVLTAVDNGKNIKNRKIDQDQDQDLMDSGSDQDEERRMANSKAEKGKQSRKSKVYFLFFLHY